MTTTTPSTPVIRKPVAWRRVALHAGCLAALLVMLYPLAWLLATSVKPADEVIASPTCCRAAWNGPTTRRLSTV